MATDTTTETDTSTEDTSGLKSKNADLVKRLKAMELRATTAEAAAENAKDDAANASSDELTKAQRQITKLQTDLAAATQRADNAEDSYRNYRATAAINEAIASNNVDSKHSAMLAKAYRNDVEFSDDGEPTINGKAVDAFFKSYFAKDGLSYVRASANSGGAAQGSDGTKSSDWTKAPETPDEYNRFMSLSATDKEQANALSRASGIDLS